MAIWRLISTRRASGVAACVLIAATGGAICCGPLAHPASKLGRAIGSRRKIGARIGNVRNCLLRFVGGFGRADALVCRVEIGARRNLFACAEP